MTILTNAVDILRAGFQDSQTFRDVIRKLDHIEAETGFPLKEVIATALAAEDLSEAKRALLRAMRAWVSTNGDERLADLLTSLREIESRPAAKDRQLGWPSKEWTTPLLGHTLPDVFSLTLKAEGAAMFEVFETDAKLPAGLIADDHAQALGAIVLRGTLSSDVGVKAPLPKAAISVGVNASVARKITTVYQFTKRDQLAGLALAGALGKLALPNHLESVAQRFSPEGAAQCIGIVFEGAGDLGAHAGVQAAFPTQYGTFGFKLSGAATLSRGFSYVISPVTQAGPATQSPKVMIGASSISSFGNELDLGVSYSIGLSSISPGAARAILSQMTEINEKIIAVDETVGDLSETAKSWLKPGTLIKGEIEKNLKALLGKPDDDMGRGLRLGRALAGLVGFEGDMADAPTVVAESLAESISGLVDDHLDNFNIPNHIFSADLSEVLKDHLQARFLGILESDVLDHIIPDLNAKLQKTEENLNSAVADQIKALLGMDGDDTIDALGAFIAQARRLSQKILETVSKAQTELLAAEIGWRRARKRSSQVQYQAIFDPQSETAKAAFKNAVLSPRAFGELLIEGGAPTGVTVREIGAQASLFEEKGPRWSLAFLGFNQAGEIKKMSDVKVSNTHYGTALIASGNLSRIRRRGDQERIASFMSAMTLLEAKPAPQSDAPKPDGWFEIDGPRAAATLGLKLDAEDDTLTRKDAEKLLQGFAASGLLSTAVQRKLIADLDAAINAKSGGRGNPDSVPGGITMGLAVPSSQVIKLLEAAAGIAILQPIGPQPPGLESLDAPSTMPGASFIKDATMRALAQHDPESVDDAAAALQVLEAEGDIGPSGGLSSGRGARGFGLESFESADVPPSRYDVLARIASLPTTALKTDETGGFFLEDLPSDEVVAARSSVKELREAIDALDAALKTAHQIYARPLPPPINPSAPDHALLAEHHVLAKWAEEKQFDMENAVRRFLKPFGPIFRRGRANKRLVAMFVALQEATRIVTQTAPPLTVSLITADAKPISYISPLKQS